MKLAAVGLFSIVLAAVAGCGMADERDWQRVENDEYEIVATFPTDEPLCAARAGDHAHGFFQGMDLPCQEGEVPPRRNIIVWADHNVADYSHDEAAALFCPDEAKRGVLDVETAPDRGWSVTCSDPYGPGLERITVAFFARERDPGRGFGPDRIDLLYRAHVATDAAHREADLQLFEDLLGRLEFAGTKLSVSR